MNPHYDPPPPPPPGSAHAAAAAAARYQHHQPVYQYVVPDGRRSDSSTSHLKLSLFYH